MGAEGAWTLSGAGGLGAIESALPVAGGGEEHELDLGCVTVSWRGGTSCGPGDREQEEPCQNRGGRYLQGHALGEATCSPRLWALRHPSLSPGPR